MDAKYDNIAITPRNGKCVEVNSLWYNANKIMVELSNKFENKQSAKKYEQLAKKCKLEFCDKFYNKKRKCLYDVLGDSKIRPNQLYALSLTYPVIDPSSEIAKNIMKVVETKLLNNYGLKTLAKGENGYIEEYLGTPEQRDKSYHQGITWTWLLGLYYNALKNMIKEIKSKKEKQELEEKIEKFRINIVKTFTKEIEENRCIGNISEIHDSKKPFTARGCTAQAWSIAEVFRIFNDYRKEIK